MTRAQAQEIVNINKQGLGDFLSEHCRKHLLVMESYANGNDLQYWSSAHRDWRNVRGEPVFSIDDSYRVKPPKTMVCIQNVQYWLDFDEAIKEGLLIKV